uniref:Protein MON2 homolog n=1 Tax=Rhabditophanes sp. KR3021 TaxID=114890 RepID=A0AC35U800_9BILA
MANLGNLTGDPKQLISNLLSDLRALQTEAKKKFRHVLEAAETVVVKVRTISTISTNESLIINLRASSTEILNPFLLACSSHNSKLAEISLIALQRMLQYRIVDAISAPSIVNELCRLVEAECEELRVLQTITPFVSTELLVTGHSLAKCICLALKLNFNKEAAVINAASAVIRQLFSSVFDRVVQEDKMNMDDSSNAALHVNRTSTLNLPNLRPCALDGYLLLKDLCSLLNNEKADWISGIKEMPLTLGLELLEMILKDFPIVFYNHPEYSKLIKEKIVPLLLKGFSTNYTSNALHINNISPKPATQSTHNAQFASSFAKHIFPNIVRLMRIVNVLITSYFSLLHVECEIFISVLIKYLHSDHIWQATIALEVLHRVLSQPDLLKWCSTNFEMKEKSDKVISSVSDELRKFTISVFTNPDSPLANFEDDLHDNIPSGQNGFMVKGNGIVLHENINTKRGVLLDALDKHEFVSIPFGYFHSLLYFCIFNFIQSLYAAIEDDKTVNEVPASIISQTLFDSAYKNMLEAVILLLDCSVDDSITDALLNNISTLFIAACKLDKRIAKDQLLRALCKGSLPTNYFKSFIKVEEITDGEDKSKKQVGEHHENGKNKSSEDTGNGLAASQVLAVGTICPFPNMPSSLNNQTVVLTAKNIMASRSLLSVAKDNGKYFSESWKVFLSTIQHLVWILRMKPTSSGHFKISADSGDNSSNTASNLPIPILTTAVLSEIKVIGDMIFKIFSDSDTYNEVDLHHVLNALRELSIDSMIVSQNGNKEPSFFAISKILQISLANISRLENFWNLVTGHLIEATSHPHAVLRESGATALTMLVQAALKSLPGGCENRYKLEMLILTPLSTLSECEYVDVRKKQIDCLVEILHFNGEEMTQAIWPTLLNMPLQLVDGQNRIVDPSTLKDGYSMICKVVNNHLTRLPYECMATMVRILSKFSEQKYELNISLVALETLWTIGDFINLKYKKHLSADEKKQFWLVLFDGIVGLAIDTRPPIRKCACQTIIQAMSSQTFQLKVETWEHLLKEILLPLMETIQEKTMSASKTSDNTTGDGSDLSIRVHHSRDTDYKQWAETSVQMLHGLIKILIAQRNTIQTINKFNDLWKNVLQILFNACTLDNQVISLSGFECFYELLSLKIVPSFIDGINKSDDKKMWSDVLLKMSWDYLIKIEKQIVIDNALEGKQTIIFLIGQKQLTVFMQTLGYLFSLMKGSFKAEYFLKESFFKNLVTITTWPVTPDQKSSIYPAYNCDLPAFQQTVLDFVTYFGTYTLLRDSALRSTMPKVIEVLTKYSDYSVNQPMVPIDKVTNAPIKDLTMPKFVKFAETSMKILVDFYIHGSEIPEVIKDHSAIKIIKMLKKPLTMKYNCPNQNTWQMGVQYLFNIMKVTLPIAQANEEEFKEFWDEIPDCVENFLFKTTKHSVQLSVDERKRHEYVDCQFIEFIRLEILSKAEKLPMHFLKRIIEVLNRGTISCLSNDDVFALDSHLERTDLSKVCFDALLSTCNVNVAPSAINSKDSHKSEFGFKAVIALMEKCKSVIQEYTKESRRSGRYPMQSLRHSELLSVLQAINSLIHGLLDKSDMMHKELLLNIAKMFPSIIEMVPSLHGDQRIELAVMSVLNAYNSFMNYLISHVSNVK